MVRQTQKQERYCMVRDRCADVLVVPRRPEKKENEIDYCTDGERREDTDGQLYTQVGRLTEHTREQIGIEAEGWEDRWMNE